MLRGQKTKQRRPDFPLPRQLLWCKPKVFPGQLRNIVPPACPGPPPGGTCLENLLGEASRRHPKQMPEPPQLTPLDVEQQRFHSELLKDGRAPNPTGPSQNISIL
ncbi:hypothetical protein ATANTOWER_031063 [Ataeniobius toweri]|uniref:Uncharacterized protein n=1 Tax=Ataeniobius toweri TaxID=208326 RepID=A0ABU7BL80_9TELE|nr:hypothetical protein [Ataeniobius toweri]